MANPLHLYKEYDDCHGTEYWCPTGDREPDGSYSDCTLKPEEVTCVKCLEGVARLAFKCWFRQLQLLSGEVNEQAADAGTTKPVQRTNRPS
jgi:hypothetical protein